MQHVGPQCGQGAVPSSHHPSNYSPLESAANCGSTTSSLRQWRKKDALDKQQQQQAASEVSTTENPSHIARVAPHTHYPSRSNEIFRYPATYEEYNLGYKEQSPTPVKYSEIVETSPLQHLEHLPPQVVQKHKEKDFMEMCSVQQPHLNHMKQSYPEPMKGSYGETLPPPPQYIPKEPQLHPYVQKESQMHQQQFQQYLQKYNMQHSQYPRNYPSEPNNFLATLNKINPRIAQSIINDPHIRDAQVGMYQEQTRAAFQQSQRMIHGPPMHGSPNYPNHPPRNMQPYNYPPHTYGYKHMEPYNRMPQFQQIPKYHQEYKINSHVEQPPRNISPRRTFTETIPMPVNYAPMPSKVSPNYSQCSQLEYAQHYQHRRPQMQHEYYQQQNYKNPYIPNHQLTQETTEMRQTASNRIKQFLENWVDEDVSGSLPDIIISNNPNEMEKLQVVKGPVRIKDDGTQLFVLGSTEIPHENIAHYLHLQQIEKLGYYEEGVIPDSARFVIKNPPSEAVLIEDNQNPCVVDKVVNLHIVEQATDKPVVPTEHIAANSDEVALVENVLEPAILPEPGIDTQPNASPKNMPIIDETLEHIVGGDGDKNVDTVGGSSTQMDEVVSDMVEPDDKPEIGEEITNLKASEKLKSLARNYGGCETQENPQVVGCLPVDLSGVDKIDTDSNRVDKMGVGDNRIDEIDLANNVIDKSIERSNNRVDEIGLTNNGVDEIDPTNNGVDNNIARVDNGVGKIELANKGVDKIACLANSEADEIAVSDNDVGGIDVAKTLDNSVDKIEHPDNSEVDKIALVNNGVDGNEPFFDSDADKIVNTISDIDKIVTTPINDTNDIVNPPTSDTDKIAIPPVNEVSTKEPQQTKTEEENQSILSEVVEKTQPLNSNGTKMNDDDNIVRDDSSTVIVDKRKQPETKDSDHDSDHDKTSDGKSCTIKNAGDDEIITTTNCVVEDVENLIAKNIIVNPTIKKQNGDDDDDDDKNEPIKSYGSVTLDDIIDDFKNFKKTKETSTIADDNEQSKETQETIEENRQNEGTPQKQTSTQEMVPNHPLVVGEEKKEPRSPIQEKTIEPPPLTQTNEEPQPMTTREVDENTNEMEVTSESTTDTPKMEVIVSETPPKTIEVEGDHPETIETETDEVHYRSALKIDDNNVLLHIADELLEIKITVSETGQKIVTVIPLTGATVVDVDEKCACAEPCEGTTTDVNENTIKTTNGDWTTKKTNECERGDLEIEPNYNRKEEEANETTLETKEEGNGVGLGGEKTNESADDNKNNRTTSMGVDENNTNNNGGDAETKTIDKTVERDDPNIIDEPAILCNEIIIDGVENSPNNYDEVVLTETNGDWCENKTIDIAKKKPPKTKASKKHYDFKIENKTKNSDKEDQKDYVAPIIMKRARIILEKVKVPDSLILSSEYYVQNTKETPKTKEDKTASAAKGDLETNTKTEDPKKAENAGRIPKMRIPKKKVSFDDIITEIDDKICKKTEVNRVVKTKETKITKGGKQPTKTINGVGKNGHLLVEGWEFKTKQNDGKTKNVANVATVSVGGENTTKVVVEGRNTNGVSSEAKINGNATKSEALKPLTTNSEGLKPPTTNSEGLKPNTTNSEGLKPLTTNSEGLKPLTTNSEGLKPLTTNSEGLKPHPHNSDKLNRDPRIRVNRHQHHHNEDSSQKRRLSLQEYNSRKRHASTSEADKPSASVVPYYEPTTETLMEAFLSPPPPTVPNPKTFDIDLMRPEPPPILPVRPKQKVIDIDEFDIPSKSDEFNGIKDLPKGFLSSDDEIKQCKEEVGLKLNSIELHLPKPYKGARFLGKTQADLDHEKTIKENDLLMRRFLNRETLSVGEVEKVKEIIKCKRVLEEINKAKVLKQKNKDSECRGPIEYPPKCDLSTFKIHLKKIRDGFTRRRKRFRNLYSQFSSDDEDVVNNTNSVGYSVYQSKCEDGVPKLIIKRKFSDIQNVMQPVVRLERLPTLDLMAKRKKT